MKKSVFIEKNLKSGRNEGNGSKLTKKEVVVRWWDGYMEAFKCADLRFGSDLLWMRLEDGKNRHIPLRHVRWFSVYPESHEKLRR